MNIKLAANPTVDSIVDGPGLRTVIWFQGCAHNCKNCHNPQTHDFSQGFYKSADEIVDFYLAQGLQTGITLSGGDPFYQVEGLYELVQKLKNNNINIWCYTGFVYEDLLQKYKNILQYIDVLVDGLYIDSLRDLSLKFRGSSNQRLINVQQSLLQKKVVLWVGG